MNWSHHPKKIAPSILSADFSILETEIKTIESCGADWIHVDVMDGHFVPNITIGSAVVKSLRPKTNLPIDCHLMVEGPDQWYESFAKAGADIITFHLEAVSDPEDHFKKLKDLGCKIGLSINPDTSIEKTAPYLEEVDLVLLMSVFPGFGGQKFIEDSYKRVEKLNQIRADLPFLIEIDGGISDQNAGQLAHLGVDVFVAGSYIFKEKDRSIPMGKLKQAIQE